MEPDPVKTEELTAVIREIRDRVRRRHPGPNGVVSVADLMPLLHARDAAEAKVAAIGTVNPRPGGVLNALVQGAKRLIARALDWHVREQVEFNRAMISCVQATMDAIEQNNRALLQIAAQSDAGFAALRAEMIEKTDALIAEARDLKDVRTHWAEWRQGWEEKLNRSEVYLLRSISELSASFQHRITALDSELRQSVRDQHGAYGDALKRASAEIQQRLWADLERIRREYEEVIHAELRVLRQRVAAGAYHREPAVVPAAAEALPAIDWLRFADRFRGSEERVRAAQSMYVARFAGMTDVLDIGCGRGEFLEAAREAGIAALGIDLSPESVTVCRSKGLSAEHADLFEYLARQPDGSLGGIHCAQVIEHLPPARLPDLVQLASAKVRRGGLVAFETPNPECLAIFATHFYLDPTHTRPVPWPLMAFYLEEAGFGRIEVVRLSPASETIRGVSELPEALRETLFGSLDYAIFGTRL